MLTVLLCRCHGAEPLARQTMKRAGYDGYLTHPVIVGKEECLNYVKTLPENVETGSLYNFIKRSSSWSILLGQSGNVFRWSNVGDGGVQGKADAEVIVEKFANE